MSGRVTLNKVSAYNLNVVNFTNFVNLPTLATNSMFGLFKKKAALKYQDKIWLKKESKYKYLFGLSEAGQRKLIIACFDQTLEEIKFILEKSMVDFSHADSITSASSDPQIILISANNFLRPGSSVSHLTSHFVEIIIFEHHPVSDKDEALLNKIKETFGINIPVSFLVSMDDSLMQQFGADRIKTLMVRMGMQDDEMMSHSMISKSIKRAQDKIKSTVKNELPASSQKEWFEKNAINRR